MGALGSKRALFTLHVIASICVASAFGGMISFMMALAPAVFRTLERLQAARPTRQVFVSCYMYLDYMNIAEFRGTGGTAQLPAYICGVKVSTLGINCIINLLLWQFLLRRLDRVSGSGSATFSRLHRLSVSGSMGLLVAVATVLVRIAQ